jgi:hypothetical protein
VIRDDRFLISRRPYAVDLATLQVGRHERQSGGYYYSGRINAVWYRRRKGITVACIGTLWDLQDEEPATARQFLDRYTDGRYGGDCEGRWDGRGYWGAGVSLDVQEEHLAILQPMLADYPTVPVFFDGWWRF